MTTIETTAEELPKRITPRQVFAIRNYRLLWGGQIISDFGDSMTQLALLLIINRLTGSVTAMATMSIALALPRLLFGFIAGVYVDRLNRKSLMILSDILRGCIVLGFLLVDSPEKLWLFYLIGFLQGSVATFFEPARSALMPNLLPREGLLAANSISQTSQTIFYTLGSAAAGVFIGSLESYTPIFLVNCFTFLISALFIAQIRLPQVQTEAPRRMTGSLFINQLVEGLKISFGNRLLAGTIAAISLTMLGMGAVNVLMVPLLINDIGIPETWMGATGISQTVGIIISGGLIASLASGVKPTRLVVMGLLGLGISMSAISLAGNIWHIILIQFISAFFIPAITAPTQTILQTAVPDHLRGRIGSARMVVVMIANLTSMGLAGALADLMGARNVFIISGAFAVLGALAAALLFRGASLQLNQPNPSESSSME